MSQPFSKKFKVSNTRAFSLTPWLPPDYAELLNSVSPDIALDMRRVRQVGRILVLVMVMMVLTVVVMGM